MTLPLEDLRRPVWLTPTQHADLLEACKRMMVEERCSAEQCRELLFTLTHSNTEHKTPNTVVAMVVRHLRLPPGSFPVLLSDRDIRMVLIYGRIPHGLAEYLTKFLPLADNGWRHE